jgi:hypothetical protein
MPATMQAIKMYSVADAALSNVVCQSISVTSVPAVQTPKIVVRNVLTHLISVAIQNFFVNIRVLMIMILP